MSRMEKRVRAERIKCLRKWVRIMRFIGYAGATLTGMTSVWLLTALLIA